MKINDFLARFLQGVFFKDRLALQGRALTGQVLTRPWRRGSLPVVYAGQFFWGTKEAESKHEEWRSIKFWLGLYIFFSKAGFPFKGGSWRDKFRCASGEGEAYHWCMLGRFFSRGQRIENKREDPWFFDWVSGMFFPNAGFLCKVGGWWEKFCCTSGEVEASDWCMMDIIIIFFCQRPAGRKQTWRPMNFWCFFRLFSGTDFLCNGTALIWDNLFR